MQRENGHNMSDALQYCISFNRENAPGISTALALYLETDKTKQKKDSSDIIYRSEFWSYLINKLTAGKKNRGLVHIVTYDGYGGDRKSEIIKTALSPELLHDASLVEDDWIDKSIKRHNMDTVHIKLAKMYYRDKKSGYKNQVEDILPLKDIEKTEEDQQQPDKELWNEALDWGNRRASLLSHYLKGLSEDVIETAKFPYQKQKKLKKMLNDAYLKLSVGVGSELDIERSGPERFFKSYKKYFNIIENKTTPAIEYAMLGGAMLADAPEMQLELISKFVNHLGKMYQLKDDLLASKDNAEKSTREDDIRGGRLNFVLAELHNKLESKQDSRLDKFHKTVGNWNATKEECDEIIEMARDERIGEVVQANIENEYKSAIEILYRLNPRKDTFFKYFNGFLEYLLIREK